MNLHPGGIAALDGNVAHDGDIFTLGPCAAVVQRILLHGEHAAERHVRRRNDQRLRTLGKQGEAELGQCAQVVEIHGFPVFGRQHGEERRFLQLGRIIGAGQPDGLLGLGHGSRIDRLGKRIADAGLSGKGKGAVAGLAGKGAVRPALRVIDGDLVSGAPAGFSFVRHGGLGTVVAQNGVDRVNLPFLRLRLLPLRFFLDCTGRSAQHGGAQKHV